MHQLNRYYRRSKISQAKFRRLPRLLQRLLEDCEPNAPERE